MKSQANIAELLAVYDTLNEGERAQVDEAVRNEPQLAASLTAYRHMDAALGELIDHKVSRLAAQTPASLRSFDPMAKPVRATKRQRAPRPAPIRMPGWGFGFVALCGLVLILLVTLLNREGDSSISTGAAPTSLPSADAWALATPVFSTPASQLTVYIVQAGDTIEGIARRLGVEPEALRQTNNIIDTDGFEIDINQQLTIPPRTIQTSGLPTPYALVKNGMTVLLRRQPNYNAEIIAEWRPEMPIAVVGRDDTASWLNLCCVNGEHVWVTKASVLLKNVAYVMGLPRSGEPGAIYAPDSPQMTMYNSNGCPTRQEPASDDKRLAIRFTVEPWDCSTYEPLIARFEAENPDLRIDMRSSPDLLGIVSNKYRGMLSAEEREKILSTSDIIFDHWLSDVDGALKQALDLRPFIDNDPDFHPEDFMPNTLELFQLNGKQWAIPQAVNYSVMVYNRKLFDDAGVAYPTVDWTWADFLDKAQRLTKREGGETKIWGFVGLGGLLHSTLLVDALVNQEVSPPKVNFLDPAVTLFANQYVDLFTKHQVAPYFEPPDPQSDQSYPSYEWAFTRNDKAAMWAHILSSILLDGCEYCDFGVAPYPSTGNQPSKIPIWGGGMTISPSSPHPELAWRWLSYLSRATYNFFALEPRMSLAKSGYKWNQLQKDAGPMIAYIHEHSEVTDFSEMRCLAVTTFLYQAIDQARSGKITTDAALAIAQKQAEAYLKDDPTCTTDPLNYIAK